LLPAPGAKRVRIGDAKPVQLLGLSKFEPLEDLSLFAGHGVSIFELLWQDHVGFEFGHQRHVLILAKAALAMQANVRHVSDHNVGSPLQLFGAIVDAGF